MPRILLTGVATLDIINLTEHYPTEDSEVRALEQHIRCGGNACNSAVVIQQLGIQASLLSNLADDAHADSIRCQLQNQQIDLSFCPRQADSITPTSCITLSQNSGSRSIVHYRQLDELRADDFTCVDLSVFQWLHFEARNCVQLRAMLQYACGFNIPISIELEKPRPHMDAIPGYADVLLISRMYAESLQFNDARSCVEHFASIYPDKIISCSWGKLGAWAYDRNSIIHQPAEPVAQPVETLGAGDTFNPNVS